MLSFIKFKRFTALLLAIGIVLSGMSFVFDTGKIQLGGMVEAAADTWTKIPINDFDFPRRYNSAEFVCNGKAYISGGKPYGIDGTSSLLTMYEPASNSWTERNGHILCSKYHSAIEINGFVYMYGGHYSDGSGLDPSTSNTLCRYDPNTDSSIVLGTGPYYWYKQFCTAINGKMYLGGGLAGTTARNNQQTNMFYMYDPSTNTWVRKADCPEQIIDTTAVTFNNKLYVLGAMKLYIYDPQTDTWTSKNRDPQGMRFEHAAVIGNKIYFFKGSYYTYYKSLYCYDPANDSWTQKANCPLGFYDTNFFAIGDKLYLLGFSPTDGSVSYAFYSYTDNTYPVMTVNLPTQNTVFSEKDTGFVPQITVSDADNDNLSCKFYIDSDTTPRDIKNVSNTASPQNISFSELNMSTLGEGGHIIKYEIDDGKIYPGVTQTVNFKVDKSAPTFGAVTGSSTTNTITLSGSATDSIAGLDASPYRYTIGSEVSQWGSETTYTSANNLIPNTQYEAIFEAKDAKGHIAASSQYIYTKAVVPVLSVNNATSYTLDISTSDNNSASTQYQISVNNGAQYVTQEGTLTATPVWITLTDKKVTVKGCNPSSTYTFSAKARNAENIETAVSSAVSGTTLVAPPGSPANINATATDKTITVSWDAADGATGYDIEADGTIVNNGTATVYKHTDLNPGTPHTYRVRARNAGGPGNWSSPLTKSTLPGSPDIPANLNTIPLSTSVTVTWNNVPGATGYDIEVDGVLVNNGPNTNYIHNSLIPGTHHSYRVRSVNPGGKSEWSGYANTTTLQDTVPVPVNITSQPALNSIALSWDAVSEASGYDIEVDGVTFDVGEKTVFSHEGLTPGTQHIYRVRAKKGGIKSDWSAAVVSTTLTNTFGVPVNFKANPDNSSAALSWNPVPEAIGYDVEIDGVVTNNGTETACVHKGLLPDSIHTYRVRARSATQISEWTEPLTVKIFTLATPQNVKAVSDESSIMVEWQPVDGAVSYDMDFDGSIISDISSTTYSAIGLKTNTQHVIKVRAISESGVSSWSTPLTQSTGFTLGNVPVVSGVSKKNSMILMWNAMEGATAYDIEADGVIISNVSGTAFTVTGLEPGTAHTFRVRAQNSSGAGNWSSEFTASTLPQGPATPANIETSSNMSSTLVTWDKVAGAEEYDIEVDGVVMANGAGNSYLYTGLTPDTSHTYRVRAKNISGSSPWSTLVTAKTPSSYRPLVSVLLRTRNLTCFCRAPIYRT